MLEHGRAPPPRHISTLWVNPARRFSINIKTEKEKKSIFLFHHSPKAALDALFTLNIAYIFVGL